jgi:hypothetical protein
MAASLLLGLVAARGYHAKDCRIPPPCRPASPTWPAWAPPRRPAPPHLPPPHSRSPRPSPSLDAAPDTRRCPRPAAAPLSPPLARETVAAQDGPGHRAIAVLTLALAPEPRAVPRLRLGIPRAGRISPTRVARRGSRGRSVCPSYALDAPANKDFRYLTKKKVGLPGPGGAGRRSPKSNPAVPRAS